MSELKEIGGYIVSADPFVNHDNTLSGNGTSTSPLGLNETVLYNNGFTSAAVLTEPMSSFEYVKIFYASDYTAPEDCHMVAQIDATNSATFWTPVAGLGKQNAWISMNVFSASNDYSTLYCPKAKLINFGSFSTTGTALAGSTTGTNLSIIYKVVGVNKNTEV